MKRTVLPAACFAAGIVVAVAWFQTVRPPAPPQVAAAVVEPGPSRVAAPGRVEPASEEIDVAAGLPGQLSRVNVQEGERVHEGQIVAELQNEDYRARIEVARAELAAARAALAVLVNGARREEREEARAAVREAEVELLHAQTERDRRRKLFHSGDIAKATLEQWDRAVQVGEARLEAARQHAAAVAAEARPDEKSRLDAQVALQEARLTEATALFEKTRVRSPIDGTVLRKRRFAGEAVDGSPETPILTIGDDSVLRVRAEVDESDIARVALGQKARIRADAFGDREFTGRVIRLGAIVGRKNVRTERPSERVDTKVRDAVIELDPGPRLPTGLRVDVYFEPVPDP